MRKTLAAAVATAMVVGAAGMAQASATTTTSSLASEVKAVQADTHLNAFLGQSAVAAQHPVSLVRTAAGSQLHFRPVATHGLAAEQRGSAARWNRLVTDRRFTEIAASTSLDRNLLALAQAGLAFTPAQCVGYAELVVLVLPVFLIIALGTLSCENNLTPAVFVNCELGGVNYVITNRIQVLQYLVGFCLGLARPAEAATAVRTT